MKAAAVRSPAIQIFLLSIVQERKLNSQHYFNALCDITRGFFLKLFVLAVGKVEKTEEEVYYKTELKKIV